MKNTMKILSVLTSAVLALSCAAAVSADMVGEDVTAYGVPFAFTANPRGGGNHDISILVDGYRPVDGEDGSDKQFDTFHGETSSYEEYFGLAYEKEMEFTGFEFVEGIHFGDGGFFLNGELKIQVQQGEKWVDVTVTNDVGYPNGTVQADFGPSFESYLFEFEPVKGTAIRVSGMTGGSDVISFASCSELAAYSITDPAGLLTWQERKEAAAAAEADEAQRVMQERIALGFIEGISTPITTYDDMGDNVGGGSKTLTTIQDGYIMKEGDGWNKQFDTICNEGKWEPYHEEYIGYEFPGTYTVEYVSFYEGGNFFDGGFFADGEIRLEAKIGEEWVAIGAAIDPAYPDGEEQEDFLPNFECYTFTPHEPIACDGIRVAGTAGGSASFISCTEMIVKTTAEATAEPEPVAEEPAAAPAEEPEPVVEEPVSAPAAEPTKEEAGTAPQTGDVLVYAAFALASLAGYGMFRRKK